MKIYTDDELWRKPRPILSRNPQYYIKLIDLQGLTCNELFELRNKAEKLSFKKSSPIKEDEKTGDEE